MSVSAAMPAAGRAGGKPPKELFSRHEAAKYLSSLGCKISPRTLANLAANNNAGKGPPYTRFRWKHVRYHREDLLAWATQNCVEIT